MPVPLLFSRRKLVALVAATMMVATPALGGYDARLWFENVTKGTAHPGAVFAEPGDQVALRFRFIADTPGLEKWSMFQMTLILDGLTLISDEEANSWCPYLTQGWWGDLPNPAVCWQPNMGPMHDFFLDPWDYSRPVVAERGMYCLLGANPNKSYSWNIDRELFRFTVQPGSVGEVLDWALDNRDTLSGLATRILEYSARGQFIPVDVTDNWVVVVPEPSAALALLACALLLRRRRRH